MMKFLKAQAASIMATAIDFGVTFLLVSGLNVYYLFGSATGTVMGGISYFLISRNWVFAATEAPIHFQFIKYFLVWLVYLLLSTGAVYVFTHYFEVMYMYSKMGVAVMMSITYNYMMNKKYVFRQ
jgi:putative flippase GtrA